MLVDKLRVAGTRPSLYPVPVTLVSCSDAHSDNIITISWTGILSSIPPIIYIAVRPERHSYGMIRNSRRYVVNIPSADLLPVVDKCGNTSGRDIDKFLQFGLTKLVLRDGYPPAIKQCKHHLFCDVLDIHEYGSHHVFVGRVVDEFLDPNCHNGSVIDYNAISPIAYCRKQYKLLTDSIGTYGDYSKT